ncbi:Hypothetical predicted protein [Podarcis lilfordi]|uniref:Uncharacterized protein n=1 Tax=Podarcis lilfordi TaxID=74358 RepID=A0AA35KSS3_9SAUR|nr:Hypothetical predicted protein [Podarcis lilfordi]
MSEDGDSTHLSYLVGGEMQTGWVFSVYHSTGSESGTTTTKMTEKETSEFHPLPDCNPRCATRPPAGISASEIWHSGDSVAHSSFSSASLQSCYNLSQGGESKPSGIQDAALKTWLLPVKKDKPRAQSNFFNCRKLIVLGPRPLPLSFGTGLGTGGTVSCRSSESRVLGWTVKLNSSPQTLATDLEYYGLGTSPREERIKILLTPALGRFSHDQPP